VPHCTPEDLALAALGEPLPSVDAAHLETCAECRAEVANLRRGVELLAVPEFAVPGAPVPPPPAVWASIAAATGVSAEPRPERMAAPEPTPPAAEPTNVVPLRRRRGPSTWLIAVAAAVAGAVIGAGAVAVLQGDDDGASLASAALDPLENADASGSARVVERDDGTRVLEVELRAPQLDDAYYEVWLLEPDVSGLVPLGTTQAGTTVFEIPAGLDLDEFPVVDVSVEPLDGDPAHSGDSVVRGVLES
jgi:anti-sigma factor RsiW